MEVVFRINTHPRYYLRRIGSYAFGFCENLQRITIVRCFSLCAGITRVVFEHQPTDPVVTLRFDAFGDCSKLLTVTLPPNLPWIDYSFREYEWNGVRRLLGLQIVGDDDDKIVDRTIRNKHFPRVSFNNNDYDVSVEIV